MYVSEKETMGKPKMTSTNSRWILLLVVLIVAMSSFAIVFLAGILFPRRVQKIYFSSCEWSEDQSHEIPFISLSIANTGADELVINRVWINGTLLDSSNWESFPSMRFQPGDQGVLQMTPQLDILKGGTTYQFTIETAAGNVFSHTAELEALDFMFTETEEFKVMSINRSTWSSTTATLTLKNSGTIVLTVEAVKVNDNSATLTPVENAVLNPGDERNFTVDYTYVSGSKYEFTFYTAVGTKCSYISTKP